MKRSLLALVLISACAPSNPPPNPITGELCPEPTGDGTAHTANITTNETWTAATSPHRVTSSIRVDATLTIEKCAVVVLSSGVTISVAGKLVTLGTFDAATEKVEPVVFKSAADNEFWGAISVSEKGEAQLDGAVLVRGGGGSSDFGGTLVARGPNDGSLRAAIGGVGLFVIDSGGMGIVLLTGAGFKAGSVAAVLGAGKLSTTTPMGFPTSYPIMVQPPGLATIPTGVYRSVVTADYEAPATLSATDAILVYPSYAITVDEAFPARGLPYLVWENFYMRPATSAKLTIEPGVSIQFRATEAGTIGLFLGDYAALDDRPVTLDARGTADKPITLTSSSATPAAGDWRGITMDSAPASGNALQYTTIAYAGGTSGTNSFGCGPKNNDAALLIMNWRPADAFVQHVTIQDSPEGGIVCGWESDLDGPDLRATNTFTRVGNGCNVSKWRLKTPTDYCPGRTEAAPLCL